MRILAALLLIGLASQGWAELSKMNYLEGEEIRIGTKVICQEKESVGYRWNKGEFVRGNYKPSKYQFEKVDHRFDLMAECKPSFKEHCYCAYDLNYAPIYDAFYGRDGVLNRCYLIKRQNGRTSNKRCVENYLEGELTKISCDEGTYTFLPDEGFLVSPSDASKDVRMFTEYKDSFFIAHGECRTVSY